MKTTKNHTPPTSRLTQIVGWVGVACILSAYIAITLNVISPQTLTYALLNIIGSTGILVSSYNKRDFQPILLNMVWIIVAVIGLITQL